MMERSSGLDMLGRRRQHCFRLTCQISPSKRHSEKFGNIFVAEIPDRLRANGRPADQDFLPTERMYRRYMKKDYEVGVVLNIGLSSAPSVNRETYSQAADALLSLTDQYQGWGVV